MLVPVIKIKDKYTGNIRIVGTNHHDHLVIDEQGQLHYINWQCMDGTGGEGYGYEFVGEEIPIDEYSTEQHVEFMDAEEYIEMLKEMIEKEKENDKKLREIFGENAIFIS